MVFLKAGSKDFSLQCERAALFVFTGLVIQQKKRVLVLKSNEGKMGLEQTKVSLIFSSTKCEHFILQHYAAHECEI